MRYARIGFHVLMLVLVIAALTGAFTPTRTGNFTQDQIGSSGLLVGLVIIWIAGAIVFRVVRRFSKY